MALFGKKLTKEQKEKLGIQGVRYGFIRVPRNVILMKYNTITSTPKVVEGGLLFNLLPNVETVGIDGKYFTYDLPVSEVEAMANKGDSLDQAGINVDIDSVVTYKVKDDPTYKQYLASEEEKAKKKKRINTKKYIDKLLNKVDGLSNEDISNISMIKLKAGIYDCLNDDNPLRRDFEPYAGYKLSGELNLNGDVVGDNILNDSNFLIKLRTVANSLKNPVLRDNERKHGIKELKQWKEEHGAIKKYYALSNNKAEVEKQIYAVVNDALKRFCREKTYAEVRKTKISEEMDFILELNNSLEKFGLEIVDIRFKSVEQHNKELSQAFEQKAIAEQELEAAKFKADAKKVEEKAKIEAVVETLKDNGMYDPSIVAAALNPNMHLVNLGGGLKGISIQTDAMQREQTIQPVVTTVGQDTQTANTATPVQNVQPTVAATPVQNVQSVNNSGQSGTLTSEEIEALLGNREGESVIAPEQTISAADIIAESQQHVEPEQAIETEFDLDSREPVVVSQQEMAEQMGARETQSQSDFINSLNALSSEPEVQNRDENNYKARFVPQAVFVDEAVSQNMDAEMNAAKANFNEVADRTIENAKNNDNIRTASSSDERKAELEALKEELEKNYTDDEYADLIMNGFFDEDEKNKGY